MSWTDERVERLKKMWNEEGLSASQCAEALGNVTRNAVMHIHARDREAAEDKSSLCKCVLCDHKEFGGLP